MFSIFKHKTKGIQLPAPLTQDQEVLYELIMQRRPMGRKGIMIETGCLNPPACIKRLRDKGVRIKLIEREVINKWKRPTSYGLYEVIDYESAESIYKRMQADTADRNQNKHLAAALRAE